MQRITVDKRIAKVVVNAGIGRLSQQQSFEEKVLPEIVRDFAAITGQHPASRAARKSIAGFKMRQGTVIGLMATLRGRRMMSFVAKINGVVFPRVRDFRGINLSAIDADGNLNVGVKDHLVFPELNAELSRVPFGLQITVVPTHRMTDRVQALAFYRALGFPLAKN
mgnify:CR=1 FL=1